MSRTVVLQLCTLFAVLLANPLAMAQDSRRFQVDLLIFKNLDPELAQEEQWRNELRLRYPDQLIPLRPNPGNVNAVDPSEDYALLPQGDPTFDETLDRMRRSRPYRPLYRGAWRQTMQATEQAPSILIRGGEKYGEHYQLEGSIKLSLDRYLHINTDLWLSEFERASELHFYSDWPKLPVPFADDSANEGELQYSVKLAHRGDAFVDPQQAVAWQYSTAPPPWGLSLQQRYTLILNAPRQRDTARRPMETWSPLAQAALSEAAPDPDSYLVKRTVVMRQHRRMRSGELHFIDHPLFGILIQITPLED